MSQKGLLFTLLHQLLSQASDLIAITSPARWEALCLLGNDNKDWTESELRQLLCTVVAKLSVTTKVCLFIDGLDEFSGCHEELIDMIRELVANNQVKA